MCRALTREILTATAAVLLVAAGPPASGQTTRPGDELPALPARTDNAALDYWRAISMMEDRPKGLDEKALSGNVSPAEALAALEKVNAKHLFLNEVQAIHRGAAKPICNFDLPYEEGPTLLLPHMSKVRELARRAVFEAKLFQARGEHRRSAEILADVMRMGRHVAERGVVIEGLVGVAAARLADDALVGLLTGRGDAKPIDPEALAYLLGRLTRIGRQRFDAGTWLEVESAAFAGWVVRGLSDRWDRLDAGQRNQAIERNIELLQLRGWPAFVFRFKLKANPNKVPEIVHRWAAEYAQLNAELSRLARKPYAEARADLDRLAAGIGQRAQRFHEKGIGNPLTAILAPITRITWTAAQANAMSAMQPIAVAALLVKRRTGSFPADLDAIKPLFPGGLPADPFTGKGFDYRLAEGGPVIRSTWQPKKDYERENMPVLDLSRR